MTQEEKQLLIIDICARLPYGVKATTKSAIWNECYKIEGYKNHRFYLDCPVYEEGDDEWMIESIIPFLRPMSSMTEEEKKNFDGIFLPNGYVIASTCGFDYLNSIHVDYRRLLPRGLALEAPEGMYSENC